MAALTDTRLDKKFIQERAVAGEFLMTEQGFAIEFAHASRGRLAYIAEDRSWIAWNGTHWDQSCAETLAEAYFDDLIRSMLEEAMKAGDGKKREVLLERVKLASSARLRRNALALAQPKLMVSREAFDRDAEDLLNTPSGIVDLRTGDLTPCNPTRMLTQCAGVEYDPKAPEPERFLELVYYLSGEDSDTYDWLLRAMGYTLTGHVREDTAFFLRGPGGNGKSTLLKALGAVLGDYAHPLDIKFLTAGNDMGHSTDFAVLRKKRLVVSSEVNKGQKVSTSRLKDLSGGDVQAPRDIKEKASHAPKFAPILKLWMYGNFDLVISGNDDGTWRRIAKVESSHKFEKSAVRESMVASEGAGILRVLVEAAGAWYREGLGAQPERVAAATLAYRKSQDLLGKFFADSLVFDTTDGTRISKGQLNSMYIGWITEEGGDLRVGPRELSQRLLEHGVTEGRSPIGTRERCWNGVRARTAEDDRADAKAQREAAAPKRGHNPR